MGAWWSMQGITQSRPISAVLFWHEDLSIQLDLEGTKFMMFICRDVDDKYSFGSLLAKFVQLHKTSQASFLALRPSSKAQHASTGLTFPPEKDSSIQPSCWGASPSQPT